MNIATQELVGVPPFSLLVEVFINNATHNNGTVVIICIDVLKSELFVVFPS